MQGFCTYLSRELFKQTDVTSKQEMEEDQDCLVKLAFGSK